MSEEKRETYVVETTREWIKPGDIGEWKLPYPIVKPEHLPWPMWLAAIDPEPNTIDLEWTSLRFDGLEVLSMPRSINVGTGGLSMLDMLGALDPDRKVPELYPHETDLMVSAMNSGKRALSVKLKVAYVVKWWPELRRVRGELIQ